MELIPPCLENYRCIIECVNLRYEPGARYFVNKVRTFNLAYRIVSNQYRGSGVGTFKHWYRKSININGVRYYRRRNIVVIRNGETSKRATMYDLFPIFNIISHDWLINILKRELPPIMLETINKVENIESMNVTLRFEKISIDVNFSKIVFVSSLFIDLYHEYIKNSCPQPLSIDIPINCSGKIATDIKELIENCTNVRYKSVECNNDYVQYNLIIDYLGLKIKS